MYYSYPWPTDSYLLYILALWTRLYSVFLNERPRFLVNAGPWWHLPVLGFKLFELVLLLSIIKVSNCPSTSSSPRGSFTSTLGGAWSNLWFLIEKFQYVSHYCRALNLLDDLCGPVFTDSSELLLLKPWEIVSLWWGTTLMSPLQWKNQTMAK